MSELDHAQLLPWMCAGLVLVIELLMKGPLMTMIVGTSGLAVFAFVRVALGFYTSADDEELVLSAKPASLRMNDTLPNQVQRFPNSFFTSPMIQDLE